MRDNYKKINDILASSKSILLVSHKLSDSDAVASILLTNEILKNFYNKTKVAGYLQKPTVRGVHRVPDLKNSFIKYVKSAAEIPFKDFDTVICLDADSLQRCFDNVDESMITHANYVIIDHHEKPTETKALYINDACASTTEQLYFLFREIFGVEKVKTEAIAKYAQIGLIADTANLLYIQTSSRSFQLMLELADLYQVKNDIILKSVYASTKNSISLYQEILTNMKFKGDFCYSSISDKSMTSGKYDENDISSAYYAFVDRYLTYIENVDWGFVISKYQYDVTKYRVSFRGVNFVKPVLPYAKYFDGSGHEYGCGARIKATSLEEAVKIVLKGIAAVDKATLKNLAPIRRKQVSGELYVYPYN